MKIPGLHLGWSVLLTGLLLGFIPRTGEAQPEVTLRFKHHAEVRREAIFLEDLAAVQGPSRSAVDRVARLKIQDSPSPGEVLVLSGAFVGSRIERSGLASLICDLRLPEEIEVTRQGRILEREEAARVVEEHLQKILGEEKKSVRVREIQGWEKAVVPPGPLSWEVKAPPRFSQGGNIPIALTVLAEGMNQEIRFNARVEMYADVVTARHYLPRYHVLEEKDLQVLNRNITLQAPDVVTDLKEVLGKRTTLTINQQETLRRSMVEMPPLVKKGDRVMLLVEKNYFRITANGEVKEDGREGDRIRVVNTSSKKEVYGRVLDSRTVQVDF